jgi:hypothetical protein
MTIARERLTDIVRNYWRADKLYDYRPEKSPEQERLWEAWERELANIDRWWALLDDLEVDLPDFTIGDATATLDACFRCVAYSGKSHPHRFAVVGCVSILAPVYANYGVQYETVSAMQGAPRVVFDPLQHEMRAPADVIARRLEATFGAVALPREVAETPIPLVVHGKEPPHTTLFDALFTSQPESIP